MKEILVVEDEEVLSDLYEKALAKEGYKVKVAKSGFEAVNIVQAASPDLVVLDICMSGMDGLEVLGRMLGIKRTLPVILYTAHPSYQDDFATWPADAYLIKSSDLSELKAKIKELLEKRGLSN